VSLEEDRSRLVLYGAGAFGASLMLQTILLWVVFFYAPPAGQGAVRLSPALLGFALAAGRIFNALSNPPIAFWSDRIRGRWGRRRPFIVLGTPALVAGFILLWNPPAAPAGALFIYVAGMLAAFFLCFAIVMNPYAALLPDITAGGRRRVEAAAWQAGASIAGVGIVMTTSAWLISHGGFHVMGAAFGVMAFLFLWAVALGIPDPGFPSSRSPKGFGASIAVVLRNPIFGIYTLSLTLLWLGTSMVNSTIVFVITVLMGLSRDAVGGVLGASFLLTLATFPVLPRLTRTYGTARVMRWTLGIAALLLPLISTIGLRGLPLSPAFQGYVLVVLCSPPLAALLVLPNTLLADIAEADRTGTGEGHEAMYYAVQGLVLNIAAAFSSAILGGLLTLGYDPGHALGLRLIPLVAGGCTLLALAAFLWFPTRPSRSARAPAAPS
jgi:glycoside/pentoside/hexuronide:cation symporter, GPH family